MTISLQNLSVVIVSFHSEDVIHECIKSIIDKIEIIVVENSGDKEFANKIEDQYKNVFKPFFRFRLVFLVTIQK